MTSDALKWARKQGLNCELDIMAATLQQLCRLSIGVGICAACLVTLTAIKVFA
jgi:hypothetical protein